MPDLRAFLARGRRVAGLLIFRIASVTEPSRVRAIAVTKAGPIRFIRTNVLSQNSDRASAVAWPGVT